MINRYEVAARAKFDAIKYKVKVPHHLEYEAAIEAVKLRLINIVNREYALELFDAGLLDLNDVDQATTLAEVTCIIDAYLEVTNFYANNYKTFRWMIHEEFFKNKINGGDLNVWNELLQHNINYKSLNWNQARRFVIDVLSRTNASIKQANFVARDDNELYEYKFYNFIKYLQIAINDDDFWSQHAKGAFGGSIAKPKIPKDIKLLQENAQLTEMIDPPSNINHYLSAVENLQALMNIAKKGIYKKGLFEVRGKEIDLLQLIAGLDDLINSKIGLRRKNMLLNDALIKMVALYNPKVNELSNENMLN